MPPHPEPALPGLSGSTPCRPGGREETLRLHPLAPSPDGERFQFSPPSGESEPRGAGCLPSALQGRALAMPARPSIRVQLRLVSTLQPGEDEAQLLG